MTDMKQIALGLYRVFWKSGGSSVAAIGQDAKGDRWIAPTNWLRPDRLEKHALAITRVERIDQAEPPPDRESIIERMRQRMMLRALRRLTKHHKAMGAAYDKTTPAQQKGRGSAEWQHARDLVNRAENDLWSLLEFNEAVVLDGFAYTKDPSMVIGRHRLVSLDGVKI